MEVGGEVQETWSYPGCVSGHGRRSGCFCPSYPPPPGARSIVLWVYCVVRFLRGCSNGCVSFSFLIALRPSLLYLYWFVLCVGWYWTLWSLLSLSLALSCWSLEVFHQRKPIGLAGGFLSEGDCLQLHFRYKSKVCFGDFLRYNICPSMPTLLSLSQYY